MATRASELKWPGKKRGWPEREGREGREGRETEREEKGGREKSKGMTGLR